MFLISTLTTRLQKKYRAKVTRRLNSKISKVFKKGKSQQKKKKYVGAVYTFRKVLKINNNQNYNDTEERLKQLLKETDVKKAIASFNTKGEKFSAGGKLTKALKQFLKAQNIDPDDARAESGIKKIKKKLVDAANKPFEKGFKYYQKRKYKKAIKKFNASLKIYPKHEQAKHYLKLSEISKNNENVYKTAKAHYKKKNPFEALKNLSIISGDNKKAAKLKKKCIKYIRVRLKSYFRKAVYYYENQKLNQSLYLLNWILYVKPSHKKAKKYQALAQKKLQTLKRL